MVKLLDRYVVLLYSGQLLGAVHSYDAHQVQVRNPQQSQQHHPLNEEWQMLLSVHHILNVGPSHAEHVHQQRKRKNQLLTRVLDFA